MIIGSGHEVKRKVCHATGNDCDDSDNRNGGDDVGYGDERGHFMKKAVRMMFARITMTKMMERLLM